MKIRCEKQTLLDAVSNVGRAVSQKSAYPALEGIFVRAMNRSLFLAGYDMELGITTTIEAEVSEPGEIVLNARLFADIVRKLPSDEVELSTDDKMNVFIKSGMSSFHIMGVSATEYPELPTVDAGTGFAVPQNVLRGMIRQTIFAVSQDDSRPVHKGILFEMNGSELRLIAVDGSRLALRCENIKNSEEMQFVIPGKTLQEVMKLLSDEETPVSLAVGRRHVVMEIDGYAVISRLLEGEFLPYRKAIPNEVATSIRVNTRALISAVERASLIISDYVKSPLVCQFGDGEIRISCNTQMGSVNDVLTAQISGQPEKIAFNSRLMLDALKNTECDEVRIEIKGSLSPMKILPVEGDSFLFLVLPVRMK